MFSVISDLPGKIIGVMDIKLCKHLSRLSIRVWAYNTLISSNAGENILKQLFISKRDPDANCSISFENSFCCSSLNHSVRAKPRSFLSLYGKTLLKNNMFLHFKFILGVCFAAIFATFNVFYVLYMSNHLCGSTINDC
jgi:hypothetical protein